MQGNAMGKMTGMVVETKWGENINLGNSPVSETTFELSTKSSNYVFYVSVSLMQYIVAYFSEISNYKLNKRCDTFINGWEEWMKNGTKRVL